MEYIMLRLRTTEGMNIREFENRFRRRFDPLGARLEVYADHGLAQRTEQGWRLTPRGFLVSNHIIGGAAGAPEPGEAGASAPGAGGRLPGGMRASESALTK